MSSVKSYNTNIYKEMCKRLLKRGHFRTIGPSDYRPFGLSGRHRKNHLVMQEIKYKARPSTYDGISTNMLCRSSLQVKD